LSLKFIFYDLFVHESALEQEKSTLYIAYIFIRHKGSNDSRQTDTQTHSQKTQLENKIE